MVCCPNCNAQAVIRTSWTAINPGRRFSCCPGSCGIIEWYDDPMYLRAVQIIPGLLRNINALQTRSNELQSVMTEQAKQACRLKWILAISWFLFVAYLMK
ncbi:hypothetical protein Tco_0497475 [Tanacetum coccineum]